jgi:hypothetical protein
MLPAVPSTVSMISLTPHFCCFDHFLSFTVFVPWWGCCVVTKFQHRCLYVRTCIDRSANMLYQELSYFSNSFNLKPLFCYVVRTVHFVMKLYNDQRHAQVFNLFYLSIYFCLTCFGFSFSPSSEAGVQLRQWFKSPGYGLSARARMEPWNIYRDVFETVGTLYVARYTFQCPASCRRQKRSSSC